ncbi:MAG: response regulator [Anaerolineales bacterium]|nr:response regulator [Anaerolineales bacterium]
MADKIRILIVDDLPETRENVRKLLQFEPDVEVVAQAGDGNQAVQLAEKHEPDVVLMDINMPGQDGISASQQITRAVPSAQIIIMSVQSEADYLRRAMLAGARDFLMKPFSGDELMAAIRRVYETRPAIVPMMSQAAGASGTAVAGAEDAIDGHILTVYSPKGGCGCTTIAINLAVALAQRGHKTALVDASLQFGDVAVTLNLRPTTTIVDLIDRISELDADLISSVMLEHSSGLKVLLAPARPEMADLVTAEHMETLLRRLGQLFDYVIVDTPSGLNDVTLSALDVADRIVLVTQQSLSSLTNTRRFFDLMDELHYDINKTMLVVNRASDKLGISVKDVADALKRNVVVAIQANDVVVIGAADRAQPLVSASRGKRDIFRTSFSKLTSSVEESFGEKSKDETISSNGSVGTGKKKGFFARLFSR